MSAQELTRQNNMIDSLCDSATRVTLLADLAYAQCQAWIATSLCTLKLTVTKCLGGVQIHAHGLRWGTKVVQACLRMLPFWQAWFATHPNQSQPFSKVWPCCVALSLAASPSDCNALCQMQAFHIADHPALLQP